MTFPLFDRPLPPRSYQWWYVDGISDDGRHGITLIAFIGSVFSPYYRHQRRGGAAADPQNHCAFNIALYGDTRRWTMTERDHSTLHRSADELTIGPSRLRRDGHRLIYELRERGMPLPRAVWGRVTVEPLAMNEQQFALDPDQRHHWWPVAPVARITVEMDSPSLRWSGHAYFDSNRGDEPLEQGFREWQWCRCTLPDGCGIFYDALCHDGSRQQLALRAGRNGHLSSQPPPATGALARTGWRIDRRVPDEAGTARLLATWEDTPFYARSLIDTTLFGHRTTGVHESLDMKRFTHPLVQWMLPFRMPRRSR